MEKCSYIVAFRMAATHLWIYCIEQIWLGIDPAEAKDQVQRTQSPVSISKAQQWILSKETSQTNKSRRIGKKLQFVQAAQGRRKTLRSLFQGRAKGLSFQITERTLTRGKTLSSSTKRKQAKL
jgi:hypothetical protein